MPPEHRRRGIGTALLEYLVDTCRRARTLDRADRGVTCPSSSATTIRTGSSPSSNGFALANVEIAPHAAAPGAGGQSGRVGGRGRTEHHQDYRLETFHGRNPDELLESYCYLLNQLALDAPTGDIEFEAEAMTPEGLARA